MNILYLTSSIPNKENKSKGIFIYNRIKKLIEKGIGVDICSINSIINRKFNINNLKSYNFKEIGLDLDKNINVINVIKISKYFFLMSPLKKIYNIYKEKKCNLIHAHFVYFGYIAYKLKKKYGIPYVLTVHGSDIHTEPYKSKKIKKNTLLVLENAEKVIFVSEYLKKEAEKIGFYSNSSEVIYNGINKKFFFKKNKIDTSNQKKVGFIGNLFKEKGAEFIPEIFKEISILNNNIDFIIVGQGVLKKKIEQKLIDLKIINKTKFFENLTQDKVGEIMREIDVLIVPSLKEGLGCVIIEAQACGTPVVGRNVGGIPEAIGDYGEVVSNSDDFIQNFAKKVVEQINKNYSLSLMESRIDESFTWEKTIEKEIKVYEKILKKIR